MRFLLTAILSLAAVNTAHATTYYVSPAGSDGASGSITRPFKTVARAWNLIPNRPTQAYTIILKQGRYGAKSLPNYWENKRGSKQYPITIRSQRVRKASIAAVNLYGLQWVTFSGLKFTDKFDLFHCEQCSHVTLEKSSLIGSPKNLHENIKVNQSSYITINRNTIRGADDNAIDFVAVTHSTVTDNIIGDANDWCQYAKGGSAYITVRFNTYDHCGTGGFTAGQGTGLQFMTAPFLRYEAYGIVFADNLITHTQGAGIGVNGAYNTIIARNRLWDTGSRSHTLEVGYGSRSCDGQPGDEGRSRCQENLDAGGWGTTRVDDGTNYVRIPNRHVWFIDNISDNPARRGDQIFSLPEPFSDRSIQPGAVYADDDLHLVNNRFNARGLPDGLDNCEPSRCHASGNEYGVSGLYVNPAGGNFRLAKPLGKTTWPTLAWDDAGLR